MSPQQSTARPNVAPAQESNGKAAPSPGNLPIPADDLRQLYYYLKVCREFDQRMVDMFRAGQLLGTYFSAVGQEACDTVPIFFGREPDDLVSPSHRDLAGCFTRGATPYLLACNMFSRATAQDRGFSHPVFWGDTAHNFLVPSSVIANQYCVGVGAALAFKMRGMKNVAFVMLGEGGTSKGALYEGMNFAGIHKLPVIFIIQNNWWAESVPIHLQAAVEDTSLRAEGFGMPGIRLNGNDVPNMIGPCKEAVERARSGGGPTFFQFDTYRWYGHSSIDPANYRDEAELEYWKAQDPIPHYEQWLVRNGIYTDATLATETERIKTEISDAIVKAQGDPEPEARNYHNYVYCPDGQLPAAAQQKWAGWDGKKVS
ncbi:MAG: thiamine pyrophosphate-dependent dehydrogenase E1 component subunit alpha [bacterium]